VSQCFCSIMCLFARALRNNNLTICTNRSFPELGGSGLISRSEHHNIRTSEHQNIRTPLFHPILRQSPWVMVDPQDC
jgi:hypothetical protein